MKFTDFRVRLFRRLQMPASAAPGVLCVAFEGVPNFGELPVYHRPLCRTLAVATRARAAMKGSKARPDTLGSSGNDLTCQRSRHVSSPDWHKQGKAYCIGDKPWCQQQSTGDHDESALDQREGRKLPRGELSLYTGNRRETLRPDERGAQHRGKNDQNHGEWCTDSAADLYEHVDLNDRYNQKNRQKQTKQTHSPARELTPNC
jgi:hypothetical protein